MARISWLPFPLRMVLMLVFLSPSLTPAEATTWYVRAGSGGGGTSWDDALSSVQSALDLAQSKDQIWVAGGTYRESILINKTISLYGGFQGSETTRNERDWIANETILDASGLNSRVVGIFQVHDGTIDGFTITGGFEDGSHYIDDSGGGVQFYKGSGTKLANCRITGNIAYRGGGLACLDSSPEIIGCIIEKNTATNVGGGAYVPPSSYYTNPLSLTGCIVSNNRALDTGGGLYSDHVNLVQCTIVGNKAEKGAGGVFSSSFVSYSTLTNCILWKDAANEFVTRSSQPSRITFCCIQGGFAGTGNIDAPPLFVDPEGGDWSLRDGSPCIDRGNDMGQPFNGAAPDMGAHEAPGTFTQGSTANTPQLLFVNRAAAPGGDGSSWRKAFQRISDALWICSVSDEVWIARGTYREALSLEERNSVYGGFNGTETSRTQRDWKRRQTILDVSELDTRAVEVIDVEGTTLDGITIKGGESELGGGGVYYSSVTGATLAHCYLVGNAAAEGGGVCCKESSPALFDCVFTDNSAKYGAGLFLENVTDSTLTNCLIDHNTAQFWGGGVWCNGSSVQFRNCSISHNKSVWGGGGVECLYSSCGMTNCRISDNTADSGGGLSCLNCDSTLNNCLIEGNAATVDGGGGFVCRVYTDLRLTNCTVAGNQAPLGSGISCPIVGSNPVQSKFIASNCIIWNGTDWSSNASSAIFSITFSDIQGGWSDGTGNLDTDPLFKSEAGGDYALEAHSPCIDSGSPESTFGDACLPPGQVTDRNDMGYTGGPLNCEMVPTGLFPTSDQEFLAVQEWGLYE